MEDSRGLVIFDILKYVKMHMPRLIVLENVKGLVYGHWMEFKERRS